MEWWQAIVLGLVEGITEYLPVSSTGHLILASSLMGLDEEPSQKAAVDTFNIVVQGGAILAVLGLYRQRVRQMVVGLAGWVAGRMPGGPTGGLAGRLPEAWRAGDPAGLRLFGLLVVAFLPAAMLGPVLNDPIEERLFFAGPVLAALAVGGVYMIVLDRVVIRPRRRAEAQLAATDGSARPGQPEAAGPIAPGLDDLTRLTVRAALIIGLMQLVALWPGTSRSMMTITAGVLVGLRPKAAAEFSFLLGLPTLGGACVYSLGKDLAGEGPNIFETLGPMPILIGLAFATVSAAAAVAWLVGFLNRHGLAVFGWYRLVLCAALGGSIAAGVLTIGPGEANHPTEPAGATGPGHPAGPAGLPPAAAPSADTILSTPAPAPSTPSTPAAPSSATPLPETQTP